MAKVRVGINGFGRIGRSFVRSHAANPALDLVLINDITDVKTLAHLLRHDSVHGRFQGKVEAKEQSLVIGGDEVRISAERDPAKIGSRTRNSLPLLAPSLRTSTVPPCISTNRLTSVSPMPRPL